jgi:hypothetical protein
VNEKQVDDFENINEYNDDCESFGCNVFGMQKYQENPTTNENYVYTLDEIMDKYLS